MFDSKKVKEEIGCWDLFVNQSANAAVKLFGSQYNNWALLIPALVSELTQSIGSTMSNISQDSSNSQMSFMDILDGKVDVNVDKSLLEEPEVAARFEQLSTEPKPPVSLDPFRTLPDHIAKGPNTDTSIEDDPDLII